MNWTEHICAFYESQTGSLPNEVREEIMTSGRAVINGVTISYNRFPRDERHRQHAEWRHIRGGAVIRDPYHYKNCMVSGPLYTLAEQKIRSRGKRQLDLQAKKPFFGKKWKWEVKSDLPEATLRALKQLILTTAPDLPHLFNLWIFPGKDGYDDLIVETTILYGKQSCICFDQDYHPCDKTGHPLSGDQISQIALGQLVAILKGAVDILD